MEEKPVLNQHNKAEYPPMHTAEHILNGTMVKMFGCGRAVSAHVERTKSKLDYDFPRALTAEEVAAVEARVTLPEPRQDFSRSVQLSMAPPASKRTPPIISSSSCDLLFKILDLFS